MFPNRGTMNTSRVTTGSTRRALGDVTNSTRNIDQAGKHIKDKKGNAIVANVNRSVLPTKQHSNSIILPPAQNGVAGVHPLRRENSLTSNHSGMNSSFLSSNDSRRYQHSGHVDDIDIRDADDPLCATDYVQDMYSHFRSRESMTSVRPIYMETQMHINERMRSILIDWLVEVHLKFKLVPETLYLTVNLIDRYLQKRQVTRPKLQLVGVTALLIASKYEEIYPPELRDLVYICDRAYSRDEILQCEETVLKTLEYQITIPSAHAFLVRYLKAAHADKRIVQLSCYILDGTLVSYNLLHYLPSQLAAASVLIARRCVGRNSWSPTLLKYACYCEEEIAPIARAIIAEKSSTPTELRAVNKKYSGTRYGQVAGTVIPCDF